MTGAFSAPLILSCSGPCDLSGPFGIFCLYVILTISYLRAQTIETSSLPTDSSRPLFKNIEIFSGILTVYFAPLGEIPAGAIIQL